MNTALTQNLRSWRMGTGWGGRFAYTFDAHVCTACLCGHSGRATVFWFGSAARLCLRSSRLFVALRPRLFPVSFLCSLSRVPISSHIPLCSHRALHTSRESGRNWWMGIGTNYFCSHRCIGSSRKEEHHFSPVQSTVEQKSFKTHFAASVASASASVSSGD